MRENGRKLWLLFIPLLFAILLAIFFNQTSEPDEITKLYDNISIDNGDEKINWDRYQIFDINLKSSLKITKPGIYHLSGVLENGDISIKVTSEDPVKIVLDNVIIKSSSGPAISCLEADDLVIELIGENYLEDGINYDPNLDESIKSAIYSKADLTFVGDGILNLIANYGDGIDSKDDLKIVSGTYNITAKDDGLRGKDSVYIKGGSFSINSRGDAIRSVNDTVRGKGFVLVEDGDLEISSGDDGIHAAQGLIINGGKINILTSYEGLESQKVIINSGNISMLTSDDGINAGNSANNLKEDENCIIAINGGEIYIDASGDGIDSNGYLYFNSGKTVIDGPTNNKNGALDAGLGIRMSGGEVIAVGASGMAEALGKESKICNMSIYFPEKYLPGTKIEIKNGDNSIISHTSSKSFNHLAAGTEKITKDETLTIYINDEFYRILSEDEMNCGSNS